MRPARHLALAAVLLGTLLIPLDSAVNLDFPAIVARFALPLPLIQWVVIAYTLTNASLMLICGRAADLIGHRRVFQVGCITSALAFVLCAAAPVYGWLLAARVLQGVGAGLVLSCGAALITSLFPEAARARALGIYTLVFGLGGALGPILAGPLIGHFGWSAVFWFRAPIAMLALLLSLALPAAAAHAGRERFDVAGAALLVTTICLLLLALNRVRNPAAGAALASATALIAWAFVRQELRTAHPIIDVRLFRHGGFTAINLANVLLNLAGFAVLLLVPFRLARLPGASLAQDGLLLALSPIGMVLAAPLAGRLATLVPPQRLTQAGAVLVAGSLCAIAYRSDALVWLGAAMLLQGIGQGLFQVAYLDRLTGTMPRRQRGVAGSLGMLTRTLGLVIGASLLTLVFQMLRDGASARGLADPAAFLAGFQGAFLFAGLLAASVAVVALLRSPVRERST